MTERPTPLLDRTLRTLREQLLRMGALAEEILSKSLKSLLARDIDLAKQVFDDDLEIDQLDVDIDRAVLEVLALQAPVAHDLRQTIAIKTAAVDQERVGDLARDIAESTLYLSDKADVSFPPTLERLAEESQRILSNALIAFADNDPDKARTVLAAEDRIDDDEALALKETMNQFRNEPDMLETAIKICLVIKSLERIGDHATNIAEDVIMMAESVNLKHYEKLSDPPSS